MASSLTVIAAALAASLAGQVPAQRDEAGGQGLTLPYDTAAISQADPQTPQPRASEADEPDLVPGEAAATHAALFSTLPDANAGAPFMLAATPAEPVLSLLEKTPRVGAFELTFYSDNLANGVDGMASADVVVSLTRRF